MLTLILFTLYLAGIPFTAGALGPKTERGDYVFSSLFSLGSWAGLALFYGMLLAFYLATRLYRGGEWLFGATFDHLDW